MKIALNARQISMKLSTKIWKMYCVKSVRVLVRIFPHSYWIQRDTEYLSIQSECGEMGSRISPNKVKWWHFSHSDCCLNNTGEYDKKQKDLLSKLLFFSIHVWWTFQIAISELAHLLPMVFIPTVHWLTTTKANLHTFSFRA